MFFWWEMPKIHTSILYGVDLYNLSEKDMLDP